MAVNKHIKLFAQQFMCTEMDFKSCSQHTAETILFIYMDNYKEHRITKLQFRNPTLTLSGHAHTALPDIRHIKLLYPQTLIKK